MSWLKSQKGRARLVLLLLLVSLAFQDSGFGDCDEDFRTAPFDDQVFAFDSRGQATPKVRGLNICETIGGPRMLTTSTDGRMFLVCENVGNHLSA